MSSYNRAPFASDAPPASSLPRSRIARASRLLSRARQWPAQTGDLVMCRWLADAGLDVALPNVNGHNALHKAAIKNHAPVCEWLLRPRRRAIGRRRITPRPSAEADE